MQSDINTHQVETPDSHFSNKTLHKESIFQLRKFSDPVSNRKLFHKTDMQSSLLSESPRFKPNGIIGRYI